MQEELNSEKELKLSRKRSEDIRIVFTLGRKTDSFLLHDGLERAIREANKASIKCGFKFLARACASMLQVMDGKGIVLVQNDEWKGQDDIIRKGFIVIGTSN